MKYYKP